MRRRLLLLSLFLFCLVSLGFLLSLTVTAPGTNTSPSDNPTEKSIPGNSDTLPVSPKNDTSFTSRMIPSSVYEQMLGITYPEDCQMPLSDLRYLKVLHYGFDGETHQGELIVNKSIASDLLKIFEALYQADYPIEKIRLMDEYNGNDNNSMEDNNTSCFNYRTVSGTNRLSNHAKGLAIDINPLYNPYIRTQNGKTSVEPASAVAYANRKQDFSYKIDENDLCCQLFLQYGFTWGGNWNSSKDYQHFERP